MYLPGNTHSTGLYLFDKTAKKEDLIAIRNDRNYKYLYRTHTAYTETSIE